MLRQMIFIDGSNLYHESDRFSKGLRIDFSKFREELSSGHDLIRLGLPPGPQFRRLLTAVEEAQWEGLVQTREEALDMVQRLL